MIPIILAFKMLEVMSGIMNKKKNIPFDISKTGERMMAEKPISSAPEYDKDVTALMDERTKMMNEGVLAPSRTRDYRESRIGLDEINELLEQHEVQKETFDMSEFDPNAHPIVVETVLDFSNGKESGIPKGLYYAAGKIYSDEYDEENPFIRKSNTHFYTLEEMRKKIKEFGHWGCWDLVTETGL